MATKWPKERRLIGKDIPRVDGPEKSTGVARYSFDINRPGMLHAIMLRSPHAHCIIESIDTKTAEGMPGVKGIFVVNGTAVKRELFYVGDEILALAADTEEHARDAVRAIKVQYKVLDFLVLEDDVLKDPKKNTVGGPGNLAIGQEFTRGDVDKAFKEADAVHEAEYGMPVICHQCLESHGLVAEWDQDGKNLTVWASTQAVFGTAQALSNHFKIPPAQVKCITHHMGGGYGSKFGPDIQGIAAAELARKAKAGVKLMLDRADEVIAGGNRPSAYGTVKIAGKKDGTLTAYQVDCHGTPGYTGGATVNLGLMPYVYTEIPNIRRKHTIVRTNTGRARAMRAPGHPQNCVLTDCPLDDLAAKLGLDPMVVRLKNLPPNDPAAKDPISWGATRETIYRAEIEIARKMSEWDKKWHPPGKGPTKGSLKHGIGMAMHTWGGFASAQANDVTVTISRDGSVLVETSSQDLGTAQRTVNALVTAEILGLEVADINARIGESQYGSSSGSGGSTTLPSQAPATLQAAAAARDDFFTKIAPKLNTKPENLSISPGKVVDKASGKGISWKEACAALGMNQAKGAGMWNAAEANKPENAGISSGQVGGLQIAEVWVDTETGLVRNTNVWAVQDCGLVINKLACESQVAGGVIMGVNYALFEDRIMDRATGRQVNPDMEFYKLGGIQDMPKVHVHMHDMPERGVIGIGEPPTISTAAAVGNAVFNAIGVRVPFAPYSPEKVLAALAKGGKA